MRLPSLLNRTLTPSCPEISAEATNPARLAIEASRDKQTFYAPHIDGLRALAVVSVIIFHAFPSLLPGGYVGVDVFFVISGYLITRIILTDLKKGSFSFRAFYSRRIRRIFPALSLVLATGLLFGWAVLLPGEWESIGQQTAAGAFFLSNFLFMNGSGYFAAPSESTPLLHLWSLAIEEQFYLAWPLLLVMAYQLRSKGYWLLAGIVVVSFTSYFFFEDRDRAFFCTATRVWQLATGGIIAWSESLPKQAVGRLSAAAALLFVATRPLLPTVGLLLITASTVWLDRSTPYPGLPAVAPTFGAALVILGGEVSNVNRRYLSAPLIVAIGLISYPLYLWHWPLLAFANILDPEASTVLIRLALVSVTIALSVATYRLLELPLRRSGAVGVVALFYSVGALGVVGHYAQIGRLASYASDQPEMIVAADAQRDWTFPPPSLAPIRVNESVFYGKSGAKPKVVFIGDSNVQQYAPRVEVFLGFDVGATKTVLFATHGGCLPIRGVTIDSIPTCETFLRDAMAAALSNDVSSIVIGAAWHGYFATKNGYSFKREDGSRQRIGLGGTGADDALASLAAMIRELHGAGKEVFLLLNMPVGPEFDPAFGVKRPLVGQYLRAAKTGKSRQEVEQMLGLVNERLVEVAALTGAKVIDPIEFLCTRESCSQFDAIGRPRYKDATHLRASYVSREVGFLDPVLAMDVK